MPNSEFKVLDLIVHLLTCCFFSGASLIAFPWKYKLNTKLKKCQYPRCFWFYQWTFTNTKIQAFMQSALLIRVQTLRERGIMQSLEWLPHHIFFCQVSKIKVVIWSYDSANFFCYIVMSLNRKPFHNSTMLKNESVNVNQKDFSYYTWILKRWTENYWLWMMRLCLLVNLN